MFGRERYKNTPVTKNAIPKFLGAFKSGWTNWLKSGKHVDKTKKKTVFDYSKFKNE